MSVSVASGVTEGCAAVVQLKAVPAAEGRTCSGRLCCSGAAEGRMQRKAVL